MTSMITMMKVQPAGKRTQNAYLLMIGVHLELTVKAGS